MVFIAKYDLGGFDFNWNFNISSLFVHGPSVTLQHLYYVLGDDNEFHSYMFRPLTGSIVCLLHTWSTLVSSKMLFLFYKILVHENYRSKTWIYVVLILCMHVKQYCLLHRMELLWNNQLTRFSLNCTLSIQ